MSEVIPLRPALDPNTVLAAANGLYESVFVLGYRHDGVMEGAASLNMTNAEVFFLMDQFKHWLLSQEAEARGE